MNSPVSHLKSTNPQSTRIPSVDWWVTSRCNLKCDFCYGPVPERDPTELQNAITEAILASSCEVVTFCGGEPLLVKNLFEFAARQRAAGKSTVLNTNGELLVRRCRGMARLPFSIIGISIDGPDAQTHRSMRGPRADFESSLSAARWLRDSPTRYKRKIATVVSAVNVGKIGELACLVEDLAPDVWRLYEYSPWGPQNLGASRHRLPREDFLAAVVVATRTVGETSVSASSSDATGGCLIVDPLGRVLRSDGLNYAAVGNCLDEPIDEIWSRLPDRSVVRYNKLWLNAI